MQVLSIPFHVLCRNGPDILFTAIPASAAVIYRKQLMMKPQKLPVQIIRICMHLQPCPELIILVFSFLRVEFHL